MGWSLRSGAVRDYHTLSVVRLCGVSYNGWTHSKGFMLKLIPLLVLFATPFLTANAGGVARKAIYIL
jgi:hypothetical protein